MGLFLTAVASSFVTGLVLPLLKKKKIQAKTGGGYGDDDPLRSACRRQFVEMSEYDNIEESIKGVRASRGSRVPSSLAARTASRARPLPPPSENGRVCYRWRRGHPHNR